MGAEAEALANQEVQRVRALISESEHASEIKMASATPPTPQMLAGLYSFLLHSTGLSYDQVAQVGTWAHRSHQLPLRQFLHRPGFHWSCRSNSSSPQVGQIQSLASQLLDVTTQPRAPPQAPKDSRQGRSPKQRRDMRGVGTIPNFRIVQYVLKNRAQLFAIMHMVHRA